MQKKPLLLALLAGIALSGAAQATLIDRGGGMIYDDVLKITWLQDANYAMTSGYDADGKMFWTAANAWAANLSYGGYDDWRLPTMIDTGTPGCNSAYSGTDCGYNVQTYDSGTGTVYSEMAYMYYVNLDNKALRDTSGNFQSGYGLVDDPLNPNDESLFTNLQPYVYWSGLDDAPNTNFAWLFWTGYGVQEADVKNFGLYAWAVRSGDVAAVPEPATLLLLGLGLAGLGALRRRG